MFLLAMFCLLFLLLPGVPCLPVLGVATTGHHLMFVFIVYTHAWRGKYALAKNGCFSAAAAAVVLASLFGYTPAC